MWLLAESAEISGWMQGGAAGVVCSIVILLLAKTIPKLRDDERADKVAIALAASTAMARVVAQNKEQTERHAKLMHDQGNAFQVRENLLQLQIMELTKALIESRTAKIKGTHAAAE